MSLPPIEPGHGVVVPAHELRFTASRSGGPGGQHVNKVASRVTLHFDLLGSPSLTEAHKRRLAARLAGRINDQGVLKMHAQRHRSQAANRRDLVERFAELLRNALAERRARRPTRPSAGARQRRLAAKERRGALKRVRGSGATEDG